MVIKKPSVDMTAAARIPVEHDARLKKIFVFAEGTFVLHNAAEIKKIVIATPAFDVAGWIDLSKMAPGGDTLFTEVRVSFANRVNVLYQRTVFDGPRLITLGDIANGRDYMSGTHVEVWFQQTASHDNYAKPVEYAYQFIVESQ
ncbi:MAG: hypothetical protein QOJ96_2720 [Alphaproteobacteria bacterium]|jgi:hypothetical protein|nr:hypothetical protein [Alphaproteobacteria bacterium]